MTFIDNTTRYLFIAGKGGVGKTSIACASAVTLADRGRNVLIVSTDPASNLDAVLGVVFSPHPTPILPVPRLFALNINPQAAAKEYRERLIAPYREVLLCAMDWCSPRSVGKRRRQHLRQECNYLSEYFSTQRPASGRDRRGDRSHLIERSATR
jgi:Anion-transporting ATPase